MSPKVWTVRQFALVAALTFLLSLSLVPATSTAAAGQLQGTFRGEAWGTNGNVKAGDISTRLGRSAYQPCGCRGTNGNVRTTSVDEVKVGDVFSAAGIVSTAQAMKQSGMRAFSQTTSRIVAVSVLDGLITADAIEAVATTMATTSAINTDTQGSALVNLRIGGSQVSVDPGTRINLAGFGYVEIYKVTRFGNGTTLRGVQVDMLKVVITLENALDIPVGAVITIGHARSGFSRTQSPAILSGAAWGSVAKSVIGDIENKVGRSAAAYLGCFANGTTHTGNNVNITTVPNVLTAKTIKSRIDATGQAGLATVTSTARIEDVNLLNGIVTADVIKGVATATVNDAGGSTSFAGSQFVDLRVLGVAIGDDVPPNTSISIPGIGTLTLFETNASSDANDANASVDMVVLDVELPNLLGLPVGTEIRLSHARATAE